MLFSEINPYIRYARLLNVDKTFPFGASVPLDARLFYTLDGHGTIIVKNKEYEMPTFSLVVINSGIPYKIIGSEKPVTYIAINFDYTREEARQSIPVPPVDAENFCKEMLINPCIFEDSPELSEVLYIKHIPALQKKLSTILNEQMQKLLYYENRIGYILAQCLTDSMRFFRIGGIYTEKETASQILSYIHENFSENITNYSIGNYFGYHPNYISFLVKHLTGFPIHQYIIHLRLRKAANLLEDTTLSCDEIALSCGFCDCAYFSRYFKKHFGVSPSKYRNF